MTPMRTTKQIIAASGGADVVAERAGVSARAVRKWYRTGVPYDHWPVLDAEYEEIRQASMAARGKDVAA